MKLILVNAAFFKASWRTPFDRDMTTAPFTTASGSTVTVPFMQKDRLKVRATTDAADAVVQLPYAGAHFSAVVVMPKSASLGRFVDTLTVGGLHDLISHLKTTTLRLRLPSLTLTDSHTLNTALQHLGLRDAFSRAADLSGVSPTPLRVKSVLQKATLDVTPSGTEATAATAIGITAYAAEVSRTSITINHPYLFLIRNTQSGAILFAALVSAP
jgi:serpin B